MVMGETLSSDAQATRDADTLELQVTIVTGDRVVFADSARLVIAPTIYGPIGVLPHHAPLLAMIEPGELLVRTGRGDESYAVGGGFIEVLDDRVIVLADSAEPAEEIDVARAEAARRRASLLVKANRDRPDAAVYRQALLRSRARLKVASKAHRLRPTRAG